MVKKLLEQFTRDRLEEMKHCAWLPDLGLSMAEVDTLAQIALAVMDGKHPEIPEGWFIAPAKADLNMIKAGAEAATNGFLIPGVYAAMIKASPKPE